MSLFRLHGQIIPYREIEDRRKEARLTPPAVVFSENKTMPSRSGRRIAVISRDQDLLLLLETMFPQEGYAVTSCNLRDMPHDDVPKLIARRRAGAVIFDLGPALKMDWLRMSELRGHPVMKARPLILISAVDPDLLERCVGEAPHGVNVVRKPFLIDELCALVRAALRKSGK